MSPISGLESLRLTTGKDREAADNKDTRKIDEILDNKKNAKKSYSADAGLVMKRCLLLPACRCRNCDRSGSASYAALSLTASAMFSMLESINRCKVLPLTLISVVAFDHLAYEMHK